MKKTMKARNLVPVPANIAQNRVVAVIPAFREAPSIGGVVTEVRALELPGLEIDLVVVDDGSQDGTDAAARMAGAKVISHPYNMGIGMSVQTGFHHALSCGAQFLVQVDGDGQHVPEEIKKLLPPLLSGEADVVIGSRFAPGANSGLSATTPLRWFTGRLLSVMVFLLAGRRLSDTTSGFRAFNERAARFVAESYPDDYPEVEILVTLARHGFRIAEVPVQMRRRAHGTSSIAGWRAVYYVAKVAFSSFISIFRARSRR
jgi:glycosyltransferase involved in cell wall biosynthesis